MNCISSVICGVKATKLRSKHSQSGELIEIQASLSALVLLTYIEMLQSSDFALVKARLINGLGHYSM